MAHINLSKVYQQYPKYKDSGVEWLGKIPKGWYFDKLAHDLLKNDGGVWGEDDPTEKGNLVLRSTEISQQGLFNLDTAVTRKLSRAEFNKSKLLEGDLLVTKSSGSADHLGKTGIVTTEIEKISVAFSNFMQRIRVNQRYHPKYIFYCLNNATGKEQINYWGSTTSGLVNLNSSIIGRFIFAIPTLPEQNSIVMYLDKKNLLIDQIVEKKQRLFELMREKRTALINYEILEVRGEIDKIKNHVLVNPTKKVVSTTDLEEMVSFVPMEALTETGELEIQERRYEEVKEGYTYFRNGDVVIAKITPCYENGKVGIMKGLKNGFGFGTTEFMVLRPKDHLTAEYLYYLVFSDKFRKNGEVEMRGTAGQKRVTSTFVRNYEFLLPSIEKQNVIVERLSTKLQLFDEAILKIIESIEILKEFRTSLISNVVTGKVKI